MAPTVCTCTGPARFRRRPSTPPITGWTSSTTTVHRTRRPPDGAGRHASQRGHRRRSRGECDGNLQRGDDRFDDHGQHGGAAQPEQWHRAEHRHLQPGHVRRDADAEPRRWHPPTTYTVTITGGSGGVKDAVGNALVSNFVWSFTTGTGPTCPCTIWNASATPAQIATNDTSAVELGVRFRADANGLIAGVRFYKAAANTGTHVGSLWSNSGTLLATATFTGETRVGLAAGELRHTGQRDGEHDLRRVVSHQYGELRHQRKRLCVNGRGQRAAARAGERRRWRQRRVSLRRRRVPDADVQRRQLLGGRVYNTGAPDTTPPTVLSVTPANGGHRGRGWDECDGELQRGDDRFDNYDQHSGAARSEQRDHRQHGQLQRRHQCRDADARPRRWPRPRPTPRRSPAEHRA